MSRQRTSSSQCQGFTKGAIVKMYLKDFMTYNEVEFNPGPNLNLILGPNGTGKSTIVAAICLGMSGKPATIARASQLAGYVRHGASKAIIQIELHNSDGPNFNVTREITLDNKSSWKFQGKPVTHAQIDEIIRSLHIQVDNLCQFLPQEQVQNFSRLKDKQLLIGTMKAVGKPELEEKFDQLMKMQSALGSESMNQEKDQQELKRLQEENKRWESDVKSFKERELLKANVKILEKKKYWLTYKEEISLFKELNEKSTQLAEKYDRAAARFEPLEKEIAGKVNLCGKSRNALNAKREKFSQEMVHLNQKVYSADQYKKKMEDIAADLQSKRTSERKRLENLHNYQQQKSNLENEYEDLSAKKADAEIQLKEVDFKLKELAPSELAIAQKKAQFSEEGRRIKNEIQEFQSKKKNIEDVDNQRLSALGGSSDFLLRQLYEALMWFRANKDRFRFQIYEPPILSLSVRNGDMAKYVENTVSFNDLTAFFCENKDDMNELIRILREERHLRVNVVHSPVSSEPSTSEFQPRMAISELRNLGFYSFLRELFEGPEPVVRYLCKNYRVHNIPVGDRRSFDNFGIIRDQYGKLFPNFFGDDKMINIRTSRYRNDAITQMSDVRQARLLGQAVDTQALEQINQTISELEYRLAGLKATYDIVIKEEDVIKQKREVLLTQKKELHQILGDLRVVKSRLDRINQQISNCQKEAIDLDAEERIVKEKCGTCVRTMMTKMKENCEILGQLLTRDKEREALQIYIDVLCVAIQSSKNKLAEEKEQIKTLKDEKDEAERRAQEAKRRAKAAQDDVVRVLGVKQRSELPREIEDQFAALPSTIPEIDDAIGSANARIQLMGRADERIVQEYEIREQRIEQILRKINNISDRTSDLKRKMDKLKEEFLTPLLELISRINNSFGRYYASMKCAGEVSLYTGEGNVDDDFKNYGIKIRVKYRSAEPLVDLSANHHSGGERAVATALYMLAMQELTQVPFRCVDEINQGMDPINERRVFDLLVETACRETSAQYFLLTPKLLPGLNYSPNMKIHFVQNGEHVCKEWNIDKHLQAIRARKQ